MEAFIAFVKSFDINLKIAITSALFGGVALILIYENIWPFASGEIVTAPLAGVFALFGCVRILVEALYQAIDFIQEDRKQRQARRDEVASRENSLRETNANLGALTELELLQLVWILRNGVQRIDHVVEYGLIRKGILRQISRSSYTHVDVSDHVWDQRDELIARWSTVRTTRDFPAKSWMA